MGKPGVLFKVFAKPGVVLNCPEKTLPKEKTQKQDKDKKNNLVSSL